MTAPLKGYPTSEKLDNTIVNYQTIQKISGDRSGTDVLPKKVYEVVASDTAEALSTSQVIIATAHGLAVGDMIRFTSGALDGVEAHIVAVDTNNFTLGGNLSSDPIGLTFAGFRHITEVLSSAGLPQVTIAGSATEAKQDTQITAADLTNTKLDSQITQATSTNTKLDTLEASLTAMEAKQDTQIAEDQRDLVEFIRNDYTGTSVTTGAYVELIASLASDVKEIEIFDSSGQTLILAIGAAASEADKAYIIPGGNGRIPFRASSTDRLSVKAVSGNATVGELTINLFG